MRSSLALILLLLGAPAAGQAPEPQMPHALTVEMSNFSFAPAVITVRRGERYRIHFVNTAKGGHNFVAKEFFSASTLAPEDADKIHDGGIEVAGGQTVDITVTPNAAGTYKSRCTHFMHSSFGMKGEIVVEG